MKRCPACQRIQHDDASVLCPFDGSPLLDTLISPDALADTIKPDSSDDGPQPIQPETTSQPRESHSPIRLIFAPIIGIASIKVHRLLVFWTQLILANFVFSIMGAPLTASIVGTFFMLPMFPLSIVVSRLVNRNIVISGLVGGLIIAIVEGGIAYSFRDWAARFGLTLGAFFGASLAIYFSAEDKHTNLHWAVTSTLLLIVILLIPDFATYGIVNTLESFKDPIGAALEAPIITIILGLVLSPLIPPLTRLIETVIDKFADISKIGQSE